MSRAAPITVEFYGIPRQRAGRAELTVNADTVGALLQAVQAACPDLVALDGGGVARQYRVSINGGRFVTDLDEKLKPGEHVLILSADAGG